MAFFNFRRDGSNAASNAASSASAPETADVVRRRAKHRLIGSAVLVLAGVVGFPLLFDTQPRPVATDIPIEIPGKGTVKPLVVSPAPAGSTTKPAAEKPSSEKSSTDKSSSEKAPSEKITADATLGPKEEILSSKQAAAQEMPAQAAIKNEAKPVEKAEAKTEAKAAAPATPAEARLIVQVGAFADADKAREARIKLEKAGLKTYTQVADTNDGKRTRVRVGPFTSKAEADKAASKIKTLGLPAAILTL
jgi:DedD protein